MSVWTNASLGLFSALLVLAAVAKLAAPVVFARAVGRVLPPSWCAGHPRLVAQSGRLVAITELVAAPLVTTGGVVGAGVAGVVGLAFGAAVLLARRRGASCGCWGSFSPGQSGGAEIGRTVVLVAMAATGLVGRLTGMTLVWRPATALAAVGLCGALVAAGHLGRRLIPTAGKQGVAVGGRRRVVAFLLAAPASAPVAVRPLWPLGNRRALRRWQADHRVRTELDRFGAPELAWRRAIVYQHGTERRALISGAGVRLVVSELAGAGQLRCRVTRRP